MEWGANAIFTIEGDRMEFQSYYKLPAPQTSLENCVAHNGSLIPVPGRDIMAQAWYQGGISVFDWTDPRNPVEIAFHDRGPSDATRQGSGGSWSVYWYNGVLVSSEIARGLDIFELTPSEVLSQNEIDAAKSVRLDHLNAQGQPKFEWPYTFALARAYVDQLERSRSVTAARVAMAREALATAERASGPGPRLCAEVARPRAGERSGWVGGCSQGADVGRGGPGAGRELSRGPPPGLEELQSPQRIVRLRTLVTHLLRCREDRVVELPQCRSRAISPAPGRLFPCLRHIGDNWGLGHSPARLRVA